MALFIKNGTPSGVTLDDIDQFCRIIGNGLGVELAGSQIGLGPNESQHLARLYKLEITRRRNKTNAKPASEKPEQVKPRNCLMCQTVFTSRHFGERICRCCKGTQAWRDGGEDDLSVAV